MAREDLIQEIVESLARVQRLSKPAVWSALGLSSAQAGMLFMLFHHKKSSVKQVSEYLGISKSAVSQLLDPLVDKKLVSRQADAKDRRIMRLDLTAEGGKTLKHLHKLRYAGLRSALDALSEKDLKEMAQLTNKMTKNNKG
jgi:DNA-binding MarR family transcriptional regulator